MYYYQKIGDLRKEKKLNQEQIAQLLNTSQVQYSRYETGERELPIHHLITLAEFYQCSTDYILGLSNIKNHIKKVTKET